MTLATLFAAGCNGDSAAATRDASPQAVGDPSRYTIVCTTAMVADIVEHVAGSHANVEALIGTGVDPHLYKPTAGDNTRLMQADVIFYSGLLLEGGMDAVLKKARERGKPAFAVTEEIPASSLRHAAEFEGHPDPHVWNDVAAWSECTAFVAKALGEYDAAHAAEYQANADAYRAELAKLDAYIRDVVATIPHDQRHLVTAHDAFGYFSDAYDIPVRSVLGITTESEAGVEDVNSLVEFLVTQKVPAVFIESSVNSRNIEAVIEGAASRGWAVKTGGTLFSDAMGAEGTYEGTYIGMLDHNATTIARALGGEAPARGFQGKLGG